MMRACNFPDCPATIGSSLPEGDHRQPWTCPACGKGNGPMADRCGHCAGAPRVVSNVPMKTYPLPDPVVIATPFPVRGGTTTWHPPEITWHEFPTSPSGFTSMEVQSHG